MWKLSPTFFKFIFVTYDQANDDATKACLLSSFTQSFHTQIHVNIDPSDSFVLVFVLVWCKVMQETLKTPSSHKSDISIHVIQLHLQLSILVNKSISGWCTSVHMSPYSSSLSNMITTCLTISSFKLSVLVKIIMRMEVNPTSSQTQATAYMFWVPANQDFETTDLSPITLLDTIKSPYQRLLDSNDWPPVTNLTNKSLVPSVKFMSTIYNTYSHQAY